MSGYVNIGSYGNRSVAKKATSDKLCPSCNTEYRAYASTGTLLAYCKKCIPVKGKNYRNSKL